MDADIQYDVTLVDLEDTNESEIFSKIQEIAVVTYKYYAIAVNGNEATYVDSKEEAEATVQTLKEEYQEDLEEIDIVVTEVYTKGEDGIMPTQADVALASVESQVEVKIEEQKEIKAATLDGIYFSVTPVSGTITSRYGSYESIRDHAHGGLDIAAPRGTDIKAAAGGTVSYSGWLGGYGYLIIIDHGNEIQTYYGHCSQLYAEVGDVVEAGDVIAAVGSTGNSTGNHLHFEIRKNGVSLNPQTYTYK